MRSYNIFSDHIEMKFDKSDYLYTSQEDLFYILLMFAKDLYRLSLLDGYGKEYRSLSQFVDHFRFSSIVIEAKCAIIRTLVNIYNLRTNPSFEIKIS